MKKAFISIALAAALFCGANAQTTANIPTWYSYQGVSDLQNKDITVVFYIVTGDDMTPVYAEKHNVTTNAAGAFSCQLGLGAPESVNNYETFESITDVDWAAGNYKVQTWINGKLVGTADLGAVPYATIAGKAYGIAGVDGNLNEIIEELYLRDEKNDENLTLAMHAQATVDEEQNDLITYATEQADNANQMATWINNHVTDIAADVETNIDAIDKLEQSIIELSPAVAGNTGAISKLQEDVNINIGAIDNLEQSVLELSEANQENKAAIGILEDKVAALNGAAEGDFTAINEAIEDLQQRMKNQELGFTQLNNVVNDLSTEVEINSNGLAEAEKSISEISEVMPGIQAAVETLKAEVEINSNGLAEAEKSISEISEEFPGIKAAVETLKAEVEINSNGLAEAEKAISEISEEFPGLKAAVEALKAEVALNTEGLEIVQEDVKGLVEDNKANKSEITKLNQYIEGAYEQIESVQTLATITSQIATANEEAIDALKAQYGDVWKEIVKLNNLIDVQGQALADLKAMVQNAIVK